MSNFDDRAMTAINPYFDSLVRLYNARKITAAQVHASIYKTGWGITYESFYIIVSPKEPEVAKAMLRMDLANSEITPEQYEAITGEPYAV